MFLSSRRGRESMAVGVGADLDASTARVSTWPPENSCGMRSGGQYTTFPSIRGLRISIDQYPARTRSTTVSRTASASRPARTSAEETRFGLAASSVAHESIRLANRAAASSSGASSNRILIAGFSEKSPSPAGMRDARVTWCSSRRCSRHKANRPSRRIVRWVFRAARSPLADSAID
jgi:hypothetical protein